MTSNVKNYEVVIKVYDRSGIQIKEVVKACPPSTCLSSLMREAENLRGSKDNSLLMYETRSELKL